MRYHWTFVPHKFNGSFNYARFTFKICEESKEKMLNDV